MGGETLKQIRKRDGSLEDFDPGKIRAAMEKAIRSADREAPDNLKELTEKVISTLEKKYEDQIPSVEAVQNVVEEVLIGEGLADVARDYILYRQRRTEIRQAKGIFGVRDDLKLTVNAAKVLERRYLRKDEAGRIIETPRGMLRRVAKIVASVESDYVTEGEVEEIQEDFYRMMLRLEFLPNSPTLMNAGTELGQLAACFVISVEEWMVGIFDAVKTMALVHQSGGGTGFSFSRLRPRNDMVKSTGGIASGPVSFMRVFDGATEVIRQGGRRRGANMGILRVDHPDILEFISAKGRGEILKNFNISVAATDEYIEAVKSDSHYELINPRNGKAVGRLRARDTFDLLVQMAWMNGDPGMIFIDRINSENATPQLGVIESTNPCGEQPLLPYESCNLGSINVSAMMDGDRIDRQKLDKTIALSVRFLDNVIDVNLYPSSEIEEMTKGNRKIGLGVMGFAEMLIKAGIPYDSPEALSMAEDVMALIRERAREESVKLAELKGSFPNFRGSLWEARGFKKIRNATLTTVAPTGTISLIAGVSSGIEPLFALCYIRNVMEGTRLLEKNPLFEAYARETGYYNEGLMTEIAKKGSIRDIDAVPEDARKLFTTAFDIEPEWHIKMQAAFQRYTDNAVSKTVNLPEHASLQDVRDIYMLSYDLGCKGITIYRYGSQAGQVLSFGGESVDGGDRVIVHPDLIRSAGVLEVGPEWTGDCKTCAY
jgi:ribonucleoside-diphosphate reductase alpha chain